MSAIGDYVHATSLGYSGYGYPRGPYYENAETIVGKRKDALLK
jgi:hypothetical protein